jgi:16S rRNA (adenine1518-N6/adenine1519-N6)-dimethyltransferase
MAGIRTLGKAGVRPELRERRGRIRPRKALGQHFLRDPGVVRRIVEAIDPRPSDTLLEIGPGEGALTAPLAGSAGRLVVIEVDPRAIEHLRREYAGRGVRVMHADILATDLTALAHETAPDGRLRVAGNIPYNITSPILFHLLDHRGVIRDATLMMQREVAQRLASPPGSRLYGIPSVLFGLLADIETLFDVPPGAFFPKPKVTSTVLRITPLGAPRYPVDDFEFFRRMVRGGFGQRRKTLRNSLRAFCGGEPRGVPSAIDLGARPEDLGQEEFARLANGLLRGGEISGHD